MKITKTQLKQIIKEEIEKALEEAADPQSFVGTFEPLGDAPIGGDVPGADEEPAAIERRKKKCKEIREKVAQYRKQGDDMIRRDYTGAGDSFYGYMMIDEADKLQKKYSHCFSTNESLKKNKSLGQIVREEIEKVMDERARLNPRGLPDSVKAEPGSPLAKMRAGDEEAANKKACDDILDGITMAGTYGSGAANTIKGLRDEYKSRKCSQYHQKQNKSRFQFESAE